ncbi:uncharacterized protein C2845_PM11G09580 [Panicum miliaceum]|uniref:Uncharacterized protein n=1 Tax=Panicum miliaceum TaxID=4540 RepID=A0A3L6RRM5_PANMI|nr:uncharacterized protein C2845_PM11G09580 [Panicum miliaceum]
MWSLVRHGLRWGRRRRTARVVDESALGGGDDGAAAPAAGGAAAVAVAPTLGGALARALLATMACAIRFDGEDGGATEEAWAASGWRPRADEVSHLMVRESMRYAIYA